VDVLSIAVYCVTSLLLELNLFHGSGIELHLPSEQVADMPPAPPVSAVIHSHRERAKVRATKAKEGLWSYLAKQSETILGRVRTISHDSSSQSPLAFANNPAGLDTPKPPPLSPFSTEVKGMEEVSGVLSTTPGSNFPPPILLQELAEKEANTGQSDVTASQNAGLGSILGWNVDHHLSGPKAFLRHQCITTLYSEYVPKESTQPDEENDRGQSTVSWTPCVQRKWRTYRYYSRTDGEDTSLGEFIMTRCTQALQDCTHSQCKFKGHAHQVRWVTGRTRIIAKVHTDPSPKGGLNMWISCHECAASTAALPMNDGTWQACSKSHIILALNLLTGFFPLENIWSYWLIRTRLPNSRNPYASTLRLRPRRRKT
jgi:1-phosphatidylinositol-3-phosphate 5-kinase